MNPKVCEFCQRSFAPRNWKDRACALPECQENLRRSKLDARNSKSPPRNPNRPKNKECEWDGCETSFSVPLRGVVAPYCHQHREEAHYASRLIDRDTIRQCEWECGCSVEFEISKTGTASRYCPAHRKEMKRLQRLGSVLTTLCSFSNCRKQEATSAHGWCPSHNHIWARFKLTGVAWAELFETQGGVCPVCKNSLLNGQKIHIDHDHGCCPGHSVSCGMCVRGILHERCNMNTVGQIEAALMGGTLCNALGYILGVPAARVELALEPLRDT